MPLTQASTIRPAKDQAKFWRAERYDDLECLRATFVHHHYPKHIHDTFAIGVIEQGAECFNARGGKHIASAGDIALFNPFEAHDGKPAEESFTYRVTYPSIALIEDIVQDLEESGELHFQNLVLHDDWLAKRFLAFHDIMENAPSSLEQDSAFTTIMAEMITRHGNLGNDIRKTGNERRKMQAVRHYLDDLFATDISLDDLADLVQLNRYHLLRSFRKELGLTPHAWQTMRRVQAAKQKLERGDLPVQVALECGFCDQSHMNRVFKKHVGIPPGQYQGHFGDMN